MIKFLVIFIFAALIFAAMGLAVHLSGYKRKGSGCASRPVGTCGGGADGDRCSCGRRTHVSL
jgi:hypothetical protein